MKRRACSSTARDTIIDHANYLGTKLQHYQKYLENVREQAGEAKNQEKKKKEVEIRKTD